MDAMTKKRLKIALRRIIEKIDSGKCDCLTIEQYNKMIHAVSLMLEVEVELEMNNE